MPLGFFRRRTPTGANIIGFGLGTMVFGMFFLLSLYMQQVLGFSALKTGLGYLAVALTAVVASGVAQALVTKLGVKPVLSSGWCSSRPGSSYFTQISVDGSYFADLFPGLHPRRRRARLLLRPGLDRRARRRHRREAGLASGLINTSQQIGGALGLAILTTVATTHITKLAPQRQSRPRPTDLGLRACLLGGRPASRRPRS